MADRGRYVNRASAVGCAQQWIKRAGHSPTRGQIDVHHPVPDLRAELVQRHQRAERAVVGNERVEATKALKQRRADLINGIVVGDVEWDKGRFNAGLGTDFIVQFFERSGGACRQNGVRTLGGEAFRHRPANAA